MNFDLPSLAVSFVVGGIGFVLFVYGKKQQRMPHLVAGLVLMIYPYFVPGVLLMAAIGGAICAMLWYGVRKLGW